MNTNPAPAATHTIELTSDELLTVRLALHTLKANVSIAIDTANAAMVTMTPAEIDASRPARVELDRAMSHILDVIDLV